MAKPVKVPQRSEVKPEDTWDLTPMFADDAAWEAAYQALESQIDGFKKFRGKLGKSAAMLKKCLDYDRDFDRLAESAGIYAYLKQCENVADSTYQSMVGRITFLGTRAAEAASYITPEIQAIPKKTMGQFLKSKELAEYRFQLEKLLRYKPHILSEAEERLLAMQGEVSGTASRVFGQLNDADLKFGHVKDADGRKVTLTHASFRSLLESPKRSVRREAFHKFYAVYQAHGNTLAATLSGSVLQDVYRARVRNYPSAREGALFGDKIPVSVYDNLVGAVRENLDALHRYYDVRKRALKLKENHVYDTYCPIAKSKPVEIPYGDAVELLRTSLAPLGSEYVDTLCTGLLDGRWVDRYENEGKRSGAFSYGGYDSPPYILMNYRPDSLDSVFTLAHEAGHSMHSYYSRKTQPYQYSSYTIFVAEVASTFNEQLLNHHLLGQAKGKKERARLLCREIDEIRGTVIRQTMFAEFEHIIHAIAEQGETLTLERLRSEYRALLEAYFGPDFVLDEELDLECLRIPHFYSAFYVYKYATGLSAAIALSRAVLSEGETARTRYLDFLKSGGSDYSLQLLRKAGVDMEKPEPVVTTMQHFAELVDQLDELV